MLKVLNTDRYLNSFVENNIIIPPNYRVYDSVTQFVNGSEGDLTYSQHSKMDLVVENSLDYKRNIELHMFNVTIEFDKANKYNILYSLVNHLQYFAMKVKDIVSLYLFNHNNDELKEEFEKHEITFLRNIADVESNKTYNLICIFNGTDCRIVDTNPKEKYNQTNFGNRYVLLGNPREILSSMEYQNSHFSFRKYLSSVLTIDTLKIKHLLSIYFLRKIYQKNDEIIEFNTQPISLLEILANYGNESQWYHRFKKIKPAENMDIVILSDMRKLESDKFCYTPLSEWHHYHFTRVNLSKDIDLALSCIEHKFYEIKNGIKSEEDNYKTGNWRCIGYDPRKNRYNWKRVTELEIQEQLEIYKDDMQNS